MPTQTIQEYQAFAETVVMQDGLSPNAHNTPSPEGFRMEPGPGAAIMKQPVFKCQYCTWGATRESLVAIHETTCKREQAQFKSQGVSVEEVQRIVVDTVKPMMAELVNQITAAFKPQPKKRGRPRKDG